MTASKRPLSVLLVACLYLAVGFVGFAYHFPDLLAHQRDSIWIELSESLAILSGTFILRRQNWARWLALVWMASHVILSAFDSSRQLAIHSTFLAVIAWLLLRPEVGLYFRPKEARS
jgi:hypothetical protein